MSYLEESELVRMGFKYVGKKVRVSSKASIYNPNLIYLDDFSRIDDFCVISGNVYIGKYVHIAPFCLVAGGEKGVVMEDFSGLAYGVHVFSQTDDYSGETLTNPNILSKFKNEYKSRVSIGKHVIVGSRSIVFPGVSLSEGCAVGAMTLVDRDTKPWGIYMGIPAKRIRERKKNLLDLESKFIQEFES